MLHFQLNWWVYQTQKMFIRNIISSLNIDILEWSKEIQTFLSATCENPGFVRRIGNQFEISLLLIETNHPFPLSALLIETFTTSFRYWSSNNWLNKTFYTCWTKEMRKNRINIYNGFWLVVFVNVILSFVFWTCREKWKHVSNEWSLLIEKQCFIDLHLKAYGDTINVDG